MWADTLTGCRGLFISSYPPFADSSVAFLLVDSVGGTRFLSFFFFATAERHVKSDFKKLAVLHGG